MFNHSGLLLELVLIAIIGSIGLVGNVISFVIIIVLKEYKDSVFHGYVLQLAVADFMFLTTIPLQINQDYFNTWKFPEWVCSLKIGLRFLNYNASILFLMIMTMDRYIAVCHPFSTRLRKLRQPTIGYLMIVTIWIISILSCLPVISNTSVMGIKPTCKCAYEFSHNISTTEICLKVIGIENLNNAKLNSCVFFLQNMTKYNTRKCRSAINATELTFNISSISDLHVDDLNSPECNYDEYSDDWFNFIYINFFVLFLLPVLVMMISYGLLIKRLRKTETFRKKVQAKPFDNSKLNAACSKNNEIKQKVTFMCIMLVICFIISWLPFFAIHLAKIVGIHVPVSKSYICVNLTIAGGLFGHLNAAINPYLYNITGTDFRKRFRLFKSIVKRKFGFKEEKKQLSAAANTKATLMKKHMSLEIELK